MTPDDVVRQSQLIHPRWTVDDHWSYLVNDEFIDPQRARDAVERVIGHEPDAYCPETPTGRHGRAVENSDEQGFFHYCEECGKSRRGRIPSAP